MSLAKRFVPQVSFRAHVKLFCHPWRRVVLTLIALLAMSTARAADLETYKVGYNNWIGYVGLFVAQTKGFFKAEGLEVKMQSFSAPGDGLVPLLSGDLDAHLSTADSVITALDKAPGKLTIVYLTDTSAGADAIVAKKEIKSIADLKGKSVAATAGQCNELLLRKALERAKLTMKNVNLINMNPDDAGAAFAAGKLDVAVTWEPWITKVKADEKGHVIFSSADTPNILLDVLAISQSTASKKRKQTEAFVRALNKGNEFAITDPKEASEIAAKALELTPAEVQDMLFKVKLYGFNDNMEQMKGPAVKVSKELAAFFKSVKANETLVDVAKLYDTSFLQK